MVIMLLITRSSYFMLLILYYFFSLVYNNKIVLHDITFLFFSCFNFCIPHPEYPSPIPTIKEPSETFW